MGFVEGGDRRREILTDRHDAIEAGRVQKAGDVGPVAEHGDDTIVLAHLSDTADECTEARGIHELHPAEVDDQARLLAELGEGLAEGRDRVRIELALRAQLGVIGTLGTIYTDLKHGRMVTPFRRTGHAPLCIPRNVGRRGPPCTIRGVTDILLATDSDALADEVEAAVTDHINHMRSSVETILQVAGSVLGATPR